MQKFLEIAEYSVKHRGIIIPEESLGDKIEEFRRKGEELYYSVWSYDESIREHFKKYQTIRSFRGKAWLNYVIFDIDKGDDTDEFVLRRVREFVRRLSQDWDVRAEELIYYYSGRGYHVYMPNYFRFEPSEVIRQEVKNTIQEFFPEVDLAIYGATSIIRAPYSVNKKTGRYKIPLSLSEFMHLEHVDIMELSQKSDLRYGVQDYLEEVERDFSSYVVKAKVEREALQYRDEPTKIVTCMQHLFNKGATNGSRHVEGMRLISAWRRQGVPQSAIADLMAKWAPTMERYELERMVKDIFDKGYRYGCNDHVMSRYCDSKCIFYTHKNYTSKVTTPDELENILADYAINIGSKKFIDLDKILFLPTSYRIYEGEMVIIAGDTKIGKSTLAQNIVIKTPHLKWLILPLENGQILDGRRFLQIAHNMSKEEVISYIGKQRGLTHKINHITMYDNTVTVDDIRKLVGETECDAVLVDTADQVEIAGFKGDYTSTTDRLARAFRELARTTKKIYLIVHHVSKHGIEDQDGGRKKLTIHGLKGSSALEQKADKVIGIEGNRDDDSRFISSLGARDETPFRKTLMFNKNTFVLEEIV